MYSQNNNVTYIDDLPELDEMENNQHVPDHLSKFIRGKMGEPLPESGMGLYNPPLSQQQQYFTQESQQYSPPMQPPLYSDKLSNTPSCLDIHDHVMQCPICSKFFNKDTSVYVIAIVILSIVCILLLKKVLDL